MGRMRHHQSSLQGKSSPSLLSRSLVRPLSPRAGTKRMELHSPLPLAPQGRKGWTQGPQWDMPVLPLQFHAPPSPSVPSSNSNPKQESSVHHCWEWGAVGRPNPEKPGPTLGLSPCVTSAGLLDFSELQGFIRKMCHSPRLVRLLTPRSWGRWQCSANWRGSVRACRLHPSCRMRGGPACCCVREDIPFCYLRKKLKKKSSWKLQWKQHTKKESNIWTISFNSRVLVNLNCKGNLHESSGNYFWLDVVS